MQTFVSFLFLNSTKNSSFLLLSSFSTPAHSTKFLTSPLSHTFPHSHTPSPTHSLIPFHLGSSLFTRAPYEYTKRKEKGQNRRKRTNTHNNHKNPHTKYHKNKRASFIPFSSFYTPIHQSNMSDNSPSIRKSGSGGLRKSSSFNSMKKSVSSQSLNSEGTLFLSSPPFCSSCACFCPSLLVLVKQYRCFHITLFLQESI